MNDTFIITADGNDNKMWGPLLEKAYARFMGSYETIASGGVASESIRALTNYPGFTFPTATTLRIFDIIN